MTCRGHAAQLGQLKDQLTQYDAIALIIGGGSASDAQLLAMTYRLPYPVLADPDRTVYNQYGLDKSLFVIQRSGSMLVDKTGILRYIQSGANPSNSLMQRELLEALQAL